MNDGSPRRLRSDRRNPAGPPDWLAAMQTMIRTVMPIVLAGVLIWGCAATGPLQGNTRAVSESDPIAAVNGDGAGEVDGAKVERCAAPQHRTIVGRAIDEIDTARLPRPLRVYTVGSRMNIVVGNDGREVAVKCG